MSTTRKQEEIQMEFDSVIDQLYAIPNEDFATVVKDYLFTNKHDTNWEGFSTRDKTGIRRFLTDVLTYYYALRETERVTKETFPEFVIRPPGD